MTDKFIKIIIPATFVLSVFTYTFWSIIKEKTGVRIFYPFNALIMVSYSYVIYYLVHNKYKEEEGSFLILLTRIIYLTTINNLVDEIFFDPTKININEYVGFAILIIFTCYNYFKKNEYRNDRR